MTAKLDSHLWQVKSRLLPLSLLETILEWFVECLPRRLIRVELKLNIDVAVINESRGEYKASGFAPSFEMTFMPSSPQEGWYYLEAALVRNNGSREASIRADIRSESKKSITIPIPANLRGTVREVFYLPSNVATLRWLPTAAPGFFSQSQLLVHKITPIESTLRRLHRVLFDLWRYRARVAVTRGGLSWWAAISDLDEAYQRTAVLRIKRLMGNDYPSFIAIHDTLTRSEIGVMRKQASQMPLRPVISLIMPVESPIKGYFREALDSVCGQIYPHWELLLVGDFSTDTQSLSIANEYQSKNAQVKIIPVVSRVDIATTLNDALELLQGEFVARIDQHDQMPPHALFFLVREVSNYPDAELIYADSDSIDDAGKRHDPRFKPDWNPDLFYSHNYLDKPTFYRLARVKELGGYRPGFDGAEDYDLSLRYLRDIPATAVKHIAKVLIHCRTDRQFPSEGGHGSGKRALTAYFEGSGISVEDGATSGLYRIKHCLPAQPPLVSIIIPTRDRVDLLKNCIESIQEKTNYENWEIIVVDNQSVEFETLAYFDQIKTSSRIKVIHYQKSFNYSALNNFAVQFAQGEVLALLNNDVEVISKEWLSEMASHSMRPGIGAVGAKLLYPNGMVQHAGVIIGLGGVAGHAHKYLERNAPGYCNRAQVVQNLTAVTGACLVVQKRHYQEVGGLNEVDLAVAFNDIDFCLKLVTAGYRNVFTPHALLFHHESISRGYDDTPEKRAVFKKEYGYMKDTWGNELMRDPAYNRNLTLEFEDFSLRS